MRTFDIYVNDKKLCTAGLKAGVVTSALTWACGCCQRDRSREHLDFRVGGLVTRTSTFVDWAQRRLKTGDEIRIVVTKKGRADAPIKKRRESRATRQKRERDYVLKKAAEYGWKVVQ